LFDHLSRKEKIGLCLGVIAIILSASFTVQRVVITPNLESTPSEPRHIQITKEFNFSSFASMGYSILGDWINATISFTTNPSCKILFILETPDTTLDTGWIWNSTGIYEIIPYSPYLYQEARANFTVGTEYFSLYPLDVDGWVGSNTRGVHCYFRYLQRPDWIVERGHVILTLNIDGYKEVG